MGERHEEQAHRSAAEGPLREWVDYKHDRDDGEEDAVDVHRRRWRSLAARRALSFPKLHAVTVRSLRSEGCFFKVGSTHKA